MRDLYQSMSDEESSHVIDMAHKLWAGYSREQLISLHDACYKVIGHIERYTTSRFDHP